MTSSPAFGALKASFKGDIVTPEDGLVYTESIKRWAANAARPAKFVTFPSTNEDVSIVIKYAVANKLPVAVKCGGHGIGGSSSVKDGIVIDLSRHLNKVVVDGEKKLGYVGGGALGGAIDREAIKSGLAAVTGTVDYVGFGGFTLGGGYGWLTGEHGLSIDNIVQATVVTSSGEILTASESTNPDLFWAIRGAGSNFGVVTEFVIKLHPQAPTVFSGALIFLPPALPRVVEALNNWLAKAGPKEAASLLFTRSPGDQQPCIAFTPFYNGPEAEAREIFKAFYEIGTIGDFSREHPYETLNTLTNQFVPLEHNNRGVSAVTTRLNVEVAQKAFGEYTRLTDPAYLQTIPGAPIPLKGLKAIIVAEFFSPAKLLSVDKSSTSFASRGSQFNVLLSWSWLPSDQPASDNVEWIAEELINLGNIITGAEGVISNDENKGYANYNEQQKPSPEMLQAVFGSNYPRLRDLKKKYDSQQLFNTWWPIEPAV